MLETIVGLLGTGVLAVIAWAFQTSNRISVAETKHDGLQEAVNKESQSIKDLIEMKFDALEKRNERLETFLNGHFRRFLEDNMHGASH